ncbi:MAG: thioredoxin family protein [Chloroflexota bacterium]
MAPIVHGLEAEYHDQITVVYLDVDDPANDIFKQKLGYRFQPHFFLVDGDGEIVDQWVGSVRGEDFRAAIEAELN